MDGFPPTTPDHVLSNKELQMYVCILGGPCTFVPQFIPPTPFYSSRRWTLRCSSTICPPHVHFLHSMAIRRCSIIYPSHVHLLKSRKSRVSFERTTTPVNPTRVGTTDKLSSSSSWWCWSSSSSSWMLSWRWSSCMLSLSQQGQPHLMSPSVGQSLIRMCQAQARLKTASSACE